MSLQCLTKLATDKCMRSAVPLCRAVHCRACAHRRVRHFLKPSSTLTPEKHFVCDQKLLLFLSYSGQIPGACLLQLMPRDGVQRTRTYLQGTVFPEAPASDVCEYLILNIQYFNVLCHLMCGLINAKNIRAGKQNLEISLVRKQCCRLLSCQIEVAMVFFARQTQGFHVTANDLKLSPRESLSV